MFLVVEDIVQMVTENAKVMYKCELAVNEAERKDLTPTLPIAKNDIQHNLITSLVESNEYSIAIPY